MEREESYTPEQLSDAERLIKILNSIPKEKKGLVVMMANAFISGMETQEEFDKDTKTA